MTLVDTNVLLDVVTDDPAWASWSLAQLDAASLRGPVVINAVVYAELTVRFDRIEDVDGILNEAEVDVWEMPRPALFLTGKVFQRHRASAGARTGVLPHFFIGAYAAVERIPVLTRDVKRYRPYFPSLRLITPKI